ncbi:hypothetical protein L208DRAFT_1126559, partial [Tricholoma matsutake]
KEDDSALNFMMDAWTLPNHRAFVAVTVHLEWDGVPLCLVLDIVKVVESHSRLNLAKSFAKILQQYGITD